MRNTIKRSRKLPKTREYPKGAREITRRVSSGTLGWMKCSMGEWCSGTLLALILVMASSIFAINYPIVDTGQENCYDNTDVITPPSPGAAFYGQDAQYTGNVPNYTLSVDGLTVHDNITGLTWQQTPDIDGDGDIDIDDKLIWSEVQAYPAIINAVSYGGFSDWRVPTIKELYSLIKFNGIDPSAPGDYSSLRPFIDSTYFQFAYGDTLGGERIIDAQYASSNLYVDGGPGGADKLFGVNFADGRIKGYDLTMPGGSEKTFLLLCVRGNPDYGENDFVDNGDGTITDSATGLMWQRGNSPDSLNWQEALAYAEGFSLAGYDDWRLPNAKELQSILDYTRAPITTGSAAINPIFECSPIINESGQTDWPFYWTSTTHASLMSGGNAAYVCFGTAAGWMQLPGHTYYSYIDVHGAGAQRSDPKIGSPTDYYLGVDSLGNPIYGHGPQGDIIRIYNYVRCVRDAGLIGVGENSHTPDDFKIFAHPNPFNSACAITTPSGAEVEICDLRGNVVWRTNPSDNKERIQRTAKREWSSGTLVWHPDKSISSGIYLVRAKMKDGNCVTKRIVYLK